MMSTFIAGMRKAISPKEELEEAAPIKLPSPKTPDDVSALITHALGLVNKPYNYVLKLPPQENKSVDKRRVTADVTGCTDNRDHSAQKEVAKKMADVSANSGFAPDFGIHTGDFAYDCGVDKPNDPVFKNNFYNIYQSQEIGRKPTPYIFSYGNHDHDFHTHASDVYKEKKDPGKMNLKKVTAVIAHTFMDANDELDGGVVELFNKPTLELDQLPKFIAPGRYGVIHIAGTNVKKIIIDTNTYVKEWLATQMLDPLTGKLNQSATNQATWLQDEMEKDPDKIHLVYCHHPLHDVVSKRAQPSGYDVQHYLSDDDIAKLKELGIQGGYSEMLYQVMCIKQKLRFHAVFSAHNHSLSSSYIQYPLPTISEEPVHPSAPKFLCQIGTGGGGGPLQSRHYFKERDKVLCYMRNHGFARVTVDESSNVTTDLYSIEGHHIKINTLTHTIIRDDKLESEGVKALRELVIDVCNKYLDFFDSTQTHEEKQAQHPAALIRTGKKIVKVVEDSLTAFAGMVTGNFHGSRGAFYADDLLNFVRRYEPLDLESCAKYLDKTFSSRRTKPNEHSLVTFFTTAFNLKFKEFMDKECSSKEGNQTPYLMFLANPKLLATYASATPELGRVPSDPMAVPTLASSAKRKSSSPLIDVSFFPKAGPRPLEDEYINLSMSGSFTLPSPNQSHFTAS